MYSLAQFARVPRADTDVARLFQKDTFLTVRSSALQAGDCGAGVGGLAAGGATPPYKSVYARAAEGDGDGGCEGETQAESPEDLARARAPEAKAEIAAANDYVVVTDNERDFAGIEIINPIRGAT